jgi:hypothetical protein
MTTSTASAVQTSRKRRCHREPAARDRAGRCTCAIGTFRRACTVPGNRTGREDIVGDRVRRRDDFDPLHQRRLHDDVGTHLSGADQSHAHRSTFALPALQALRRESHWFAVLRVKSWSLLLHNWTFVQPSGSYVYMRAQSSAACRVRASVRRGRSRPSREYDRNASLTSARQRCHSRSSSFFDQHAGKKTPVSKDPAPLLDLPGQGGVALLRRRPDATADIARDEDEPRQGDSAPGRRARQRHRAHPNRSQGQRGDRAGACPDRSISA